MAAVRFLLTSIFWLFSLSLFSQDYLLELKNLSSELNLNELVNVETATDSNSALKTQQELISILQSEGYLEARSTLEVDSPVIQLQVELGPQYIWSKLSRGNIEPEALRALGYKLDLRTKKAVNVREIRKLREAVLRYYENRGYPFAGVYYDSLSMDGNLVSASMMVDLNQYITIDSLVIVGAEKVKPSYLYNSLNIFPGKAYSEEKFVQSPARLSEIPFVKQLKKPEVLFSKEGAQVFLYLEDKKANDIQGIVGFLPNAQTGKITLSGDVKLKLMNALGQGEYFNMNWRKLQENTQDLKVEATYPYLFNTSFGLEGKVFLYRRDTLFNTFERSVGANYRLSQYHSVVVKLGAINNNILSTYGLQNASSLPEYADVQTSQYSLGYKGLKLDYRYNPRSGRDIALEFGAGNRRIQQNPDINPELYDSLQLRSSQYRIQLQADRYFALFKRSSFKTGINGGSILGEEVFQNELYRLGGIQNLRGFDIETIRASTYGILTLEYRYILERNSHLSLFSDMAYIESKALDLISYDRAIGVGAGFTFDTKSGIFSLSYALGSQRGSPMQFRSSKLHFGFVSIF